MVKSIKIKTLDHRGLDSTGKKDEISTPSCVNRSRSRSVPETKLTGATKAMATNKSRTNKHKVKSPANPSSDEKGRYSTGNIPDQNSAKKVSKNAVSSAAK